jgi:hypothetical protein
MPLGDEPDYETCSICGRLFTGYGNNAKPVNEGRCCDECNAAHVIPARLEQWFRPRNDK